MISGLGLANAARNGTANFVKIRYTVAGVSYTVEATTSYTDLLPLEYRITKSCVISGKTGILTKAELLDDSNNIVMLKEMNISLSTQTDTFISFDINYKLDL